jgi:hypothetical protein
MSEYTKGPWRTENNPGDWGLPGAVFIYAYDNKEPLATIDYRTPYCMGESSRVIDAAAKAKANARLMASAPKLLEAAKSALEMFEAMDHDDIVCAIDLRAAIAEAEA